MSIAKIEDYRGTAEKLGRLIDTVTNEGLIEAAEYAAGQDNDYMIRYVFGEMAFRFASYINAGIIGAKDSGEDLKHDNKRREVLRAVVLEACGDNGIKDPAEVEAVARMTAEDIFYNPKEYSEKQLRDLETAWKGAVRRSIEAVKAEA